MAASAAVPEQRSFTLRYRSQRREVWNFYWARWRASLWRSWLLYGALVVVGALVIDSYDHKLGWQDAPVALLYMLLLFAFFTIFPQLAFKPQERVLNADPGGIDTTVGGESGHRDWREIGSITDDGDAITFVVARTGNAFIVPMRAFQGAAERAEFLRAVMEWHEAARNS